MDPIEFLGRLSALTAGLKPAPDTAASELSELRTTVARALQEPEQREAAIQDLRGLIDWQDPETLDADLRAELEAVIASTAAEPVREELPRGVRISRRTVPLRSSAVPESVPAFAAGRAIDRTLGPFIDRDGRPIWFDIFFPIRKVSLVRAPATAPFATLPLRGLILGSATEYTLPAGSVWFLSSEVAPTAPAGGYSGVRISGGRLTLSAAPTVSGTTLTIAAGTRVTMTLTLDPAASAAPAPQPGVDAIQSVVDGPEEVTLKFNQGRGELTNAGDATLTVFGDTVKLQHAAGTASYDQRMNRIVFPFDVTPKSLEVASSQSDLFDLEGEAPVESGGWALAVAVTAASDLGQAVGAGALALSLGSGLRAGWRGLAGGPAQLGDTLVMGEVDRVAVVAAAAHAPEASQRVNLWTGVPRAAPVAALWHFTRFLLRFESLAGITDVVLSDASLEASTDRPVSVDGRPFAIRAATSTTVLWQDAAALRILAYAQPDPPLLPATRAIALKNALLRTQLPALFALGGELTAPDRVENGTVAKVFRVIQVMLTLPDPYVTSQPLPARLGRDESIRSRDAKRATAQVATGPLLISLVRWTTADAPVLSLHLVFPQQQLVQPGTAAVPPSLGNVLVVDAAAGADTEESGDTAEIAFYSASGTFGNVEIDFSQLPNPGQAKREDDAALRALRDVFEEAAGSAREAVALLDVSSKIDHLGITWGFLSRKDRVSTSTTVPVLISDLALTTFVRNTRLFLLPQFQWEPLRDIPNPNIGFFPDRLVSGDDGGASLFGANTVRLVPILPDRALETLVDEFNSSSQEVGAYFTLPFGIRAAAYLSPERPTSTNWAGLQLNQPAAPDGAFTGAYQFSVSAHSTTGGPTLESPSLTGAAWQTRNAVDPVTGAPTGFSALRGDILNEGVEPFFNNDFGPGAASRRAPVTRVDFAGLGASSFSEWFNPNAVAQISQVRFDAFVGRTAYEVVQVASVLYPWAVPVVRTVTMERRKEGLVMRADSGWVATGAGLYRYPPPDPGLPLAESPPADWSVIETHPGIVRGAHNVRRIRETGRVVEREIAGIKIELLEVRFDADIEIEGVQRGQIRGTSRVNSIDQTGFVQRAPKGYPLVPGHLAQILNEEGPLGGPVDCEIEIAGSGQTMGVVWVDVDAAEPLTPGLAEFAAAARGALSLPKDGSWSVIKRQASSEEYEPIDPVVGTPLIRQGRASAPASVAPWYRFSDPQDLLREASPGTEFALVQSSDGHQFLLPRPRIQSGGSAIATTERALLADAYARATAAGVFPKSTVCFRSQVPLRLDITAQGRYRLGPNTTADFNNIPTGQREIVDGDALAIRTRYAGAIRYMLDPADPDVWKVEIDRLTTSMDLGPFDDLMGVVHDFRVSDAQAPRLVNPEQIYAPILAPVVEIIKFLTDLLGIDDQFNVAAVQSSFKFQATAKYPLQGPGNDYIDFGAMKIKGDLEAGFGWSEKDKWFGFVKIGLAMKVPAVPPIFADGKTSIKLKGTELTGQEVTIRVIWGIAFEGTLGPLGVSAEFNFGIEVIVAESGAWQIGLLVQVIGKADIFIVTIAIKIELLAAIGRLPPPDEKVEAIGKAKFAAEVSICWFLTISVEYSIEYREELDI